jgi:hypothetical protein
VTVLLTPTLGVALQPHELARTIANVCGALESGSFLTRYKGDEGLSGGESKFLACTSWLADAQMAAGQIDEAHAAIDKLMACGQRRRPVRGGDRFAQRRIPRNFSAGLDRVRTDRQRCEPEIGRTRRRDGGQRLVCRPCASRCATFGWRGVVAAMISSSSITRLSSCTTVRQNLASEAR